MSKLKFRFEWHDDAKTVLHCYLEGDWNWRDYHAGSRAAAISAGMGRADKSITMLIDMRESTRTRFPSGAAAHMKTFGKKWTPALNGYAVVIGLPDDVPPTLPLEADGTLETADGVVFFAADDAEAEQWLAHIKTYANKE